MNDFPTLVHIYASDARFDGHGIMNGFPTPTRLIHGC